MAVWVERASLIGHSSLCTKLSDHKLDSGLFSHLKEFLCTFAFVTTIRVSSLLPKSWSRLTAKSPAGGRYRWQSFRFAAPVRSKGVPDRYRGRWSVHPLHENPPLVEYLREGIRAGRFEAMLHGYYHDEPDGREEFEIDHDLERRVREGRHYLEELLATTVRVFVAPRNTIGRAGLQQLPELASPRRRRRIPLRMVFGFGKSLGLMVAPTTMEEVRGCGCPMGSRSWGPSRDLR